MRWPRHLPLTLSLLLAAPVAVQSGAFAQSAEVDTAETHAKDARVHYDQGRYEQAVAAYLKAYRLSPSAGYLYNVAVIYDRKLNEPELAIDFYRRYIVADDADPSAVERASARLKALKSAAAAEPVVAPPPPAPVSKAPASESAVEARPADASASASAQGPSSGRKLAAYTLLGIGGAALVGGVALGVLASTVQDKYESAETVSDKKNLQSLGRSEALTGDLLMGGGLLLAGVGTVLLLTGGSPSAPAAPPPSADAEADPEIRLVPLPGGLGLTLGGVL